MSDLFAPRGDALTEGVLRRRLLAWAIDAAVVCVVMGGLAIGI
jgi:hypothetical protein